MSVVAREVMPVGVDVAGVHLAAEGRKGVGIQ
jgi:hypothetical protein